MADPRGFLKIRERRLPEGRPVAERVGDYAEVHGLLPLAVVSEQASRCMDCGTPFCHMGCPLGNVIPDWNTYAYSDRWDDAIERLHATNNFPEFTGRLCPAPCESACVLGINQEPVTIRNTEQTAADTGWESGTITPQIPHRLTGRTVAVIGSGPAGLAAAQQLTRAGHTVAVFERDDAPGGLLRYGIPQFKLEKSVLDRRLEQMRAEGTRFHSGVSIGVDLTGEDLLERFDAVVLAIGSRVGRDLRVAGRELDGIHQAVEYLTASTKHVLGVSDEGFISAKGKHVVVIGGGDTGSDCVGTAIRQGAASVTSLEIMPKLPSERTAKDPWPTFPRLFTVSSSHEEGGERVYSASTAELVGDESGRVAKLRLTDVRMENGRLAPVEGTEREIPTELVLLAMGFTGVESDGLVSQLGLEVDGRGRIVRDDSWATSAPGVFVAGDAGRGQSLIVWAIAEGRSAAASVDEYLRGRTELPAPIRPTSLQYRP
ncbi:glutamate synthase subunit beta [Actinomyces culturomici]|uniref:glutamate synthase subunit beta n=1 Tax=Actinomyces culturomici TaxID=1926276 RepID=UPI000E20611B|nr:glutamate synthase subunit beta [Actinomyces culturomici]